MILQALYQLAQNEGLMDDPDFERKAVAWLVRVGPEGQLLGIEGTHQIPPDEGGGSKRRKPKPVAKRFSVPRESSRTSGDRAMFLYDKAEYVFGIDPKGERPADKLQERAKLFREGVRRCLDATGDEAVRAVLTLLEDVAAGRQTVTLPEGCATNDLFAFIYASDVDRLIFTRAKVRDYWKSLRGASSGESEPSSVCLVSGRPCIPVDKHPPLKRVPGGTTSGVSLISFNAGAFESYGWHRNENAPVSREAAEACGTALNRLLDYAPQAPDGRPLPRRNLTLPGNTVVCYWAPDTGAEDLLSSLGALMEANPEEVKTLYRSIWRGKRPEIENPSAFYALTLSGSQGRAIVRDWFESTVQTVAANLSRYFEDLDIVRNTPKPKDHDLPPHFPLRVLLQSLAPLGKDDAVPAPLAADIVAAALQGTPLPLAVLQRAIERARAEIGRDEWADLLRRDARAALIKAVLNRRRQLSPETRNSCPEVKPDMDPHNPNEGYVLGRLMAVLERLQQEALDDPNASVVDRFFGGASATPKAVFVRLLKNARHHARKVRNDPKKGGTVFLLDRLVDELADRFDPKHNGFPAHLNLEQQGLFVLGYHQMRKWLWMTAEERAASASAPADAPRAYLWKTAKPTTVNA